MPTASTHRYTVDANGPSTRVLKVDTKYILILALVAALVAVTAAPGFAAATAPRSSVRIALGGVSSVDPGASSDADATKVTSLVFDGLVARDQNGAVVPELAESWDVSEDGLVYTFHLREGPAWSDGRAVTAADFEWAWKRNSALQPNGRFLVPMTPILNARAILAGELGQDQLGVAAQDERTLVVTLEERAAYFPVLVSLGRFYPLRRDVVELHGETWHYPATMVSNGPYRFTDVTVRGEIVLERNESYWGAKPQLQRIAFAQFDSSAEALSAYEEGFIDALGSSFSIPAEEVQRVLADPSLGSFTNPQSATVMLLLNHQHPALENALVRTALGMSIDRPELITTIYQGIDEPAYSLQPPGIFGRNPDVWPHFDPEGARQLLVDAGYAEGSEVPTLTFTYSSDFEQQLGEYLQREWGEHLGITLALNRLDPDAFDAWVDSSWDAEGGIRGASWASDYPDPQNWYGTLWSSGSELTTFRSGWAHSIYESLVHQAAGEPDRALREQLYMQAEEILAGEYPAIPLLYPVDRLAVRDDVHGFQPSAVLGLVPVESMSVASPLPAELQPAWDALAAAQLPAGEAFSSAGGFADDWLASSGARLRVAPLEGSPGTYDWGANVVTISTAAVADSPAVAGAVLVHTLKHAQQRHTDTDDDCVHTEVVALQQEALAWDALSGGGLAAPASPLQTWENDLLSLYREEGMPGLYRLVVNDPAWQAECNLAVPG